MEKILAIVGFLFLIGIVFYCYVNRNRVCRCDGCGKDIMKGEDYCGHGNETFCLKCKQMLNDSLYPPQLY